ncbi:hypothetical protein [Tardiphaga robiniae]|uniref:Outer membrane beta-barrel protein n=1 Tax=Tardiphaga robiniae TaxID=943830 RepID=A0A7G6TUK8_9BRAD|nr:hypothetical protein [Tardiphaga robiniae]QND70440.1 hypothetical protein HB776_03645 [Tardiphaga robiniae]
MRAIVLAVSACAFVGVSGAWAADWSLRSTQSETVEFNNNQFLNPTPPGGVVSSYSSITGNAQARTASSKFDFDSYVNYRKYGGPGAEGVSQTESLAYGFTGLYETYGKNSSDRNFIGASYSSQSSAFALLNELALLTNVQGALNQVSVRGGFDRAISARDTVSVSAQSSRTFYDPSGGGTVFNDTSATGSWQHRYNSRIGFSLTSQAEWLTYENALNTSVMILRNQAGVDVAISPLLSFRGNAGAAYISVENGTNVLSSIGGLGSTNSAASSDLGFIMDLLLTYRALKATTFTLSATKSVGPTVVGSLFETETIRAGMTHLINAKSSLSLSADLSRSTSTNVTDFGSASATYSHELTRDLNAQITYRHLHRFAGSGLATIDPITGTPILSGSGPADSDSIMVVVSKNVTILPPGR